MGTKLPSYCIDGQEKGEFNLPNEYANPVAVRELPYQKPVIGYSGSAFCSAVQFKQQQQPNIDQNLDKLER